MQNDVAVLVQGDTGFGTTDRKVAAAVKDKLKAAGIRVIDVSGPTRTQRSSGESNTSSSRSAIRTPRLSRQFDVSRTRGYWMARRSSS